MTDELEKYVIPKIRMKVWDYLKKHSIDHVIEYKERIICDGEYEVQCFLHAPVNGMFGCVCVLFGKDKEELIQKTACNTLQWLRKNEESWNTTMVTYIHYKKWEPLNDYEKLWVTKSIQGLHYVKPDFVKFIAY
jgi:hypothetical protein